MSITRSLGFFISADWSKEKKKRSVYIADVQKLQIQGPIKDSEGWCLNSLLKLACKLSRDGPVLVGIDVALGVPRG